MVSLSFLHIAEEALLRTEKILFQSSDPDVTDTPANDDSTAAGHFWNRHRYKLSCLYSSFFAFTSPASCAFYRLYIRTGFAHVHYNLIFICGKLFFIIILFCLICSKVNFSLIKKSSRAFFKFTSSFEFSYSID